MPEREINTRYRRDPIIFLYSCLQVLILLNVHSLENSFYHWSVAGLHLYIQNTLRTL